MNSQEQITVNEFFLELAGYYRHENDLSNITVSLCNSNDGFKKRFLHFFFPELNVDDVVSIYREVCDKEGYGSRVDIYVSMKTGDDYIIEVKIYDGNHHFCKYEQAYKVDKAHFGYITNYRCYEGMSQGYDVKTWENLYDFISTDAHIDSLTKGYLKYLEQVCNIKRYDTKMDLRNLSSIPQLFNTVDSIIKNSDGLTVDNDQRGTIRYTYKKFIINRTSANGYGEWLLNAYTVLDFDKESPISIGVGGGNEINLKDIEEKERQNHFNNFETPKIDKEWWGYLWFVLSKEKMDEFDKSESVKEQERILSEFIEEVVSLIRKYENRNGAIKN